MSKELPRKNYSIKMFSVDEYMLCSFQISVTLNFSGFLQTIKSFNSKLSLDRKEKKKKKLAKLVNL
jgi:hypothetical protein